MTQASNMVLVAEVMASDGLMNSGLNLACSRILMSNCIFAQAAKFVVLHLPSSLHAEPFNCAIGCCIGSSHVKLFSPVCAWYACLNAYFVATPKLCLWYCRFWSDILILVMKCPINWKRVMWCGDGIKWKCDKLEMCNVQGRGHGTCNILMYHIIFQHHYSLMAAVLWLIMHDSVWIQQDCLNRTVI